MIEKKIILSSCWNFYLFEWIFLFTLMISKWFETKVLFGFCHLLLIKLPRFRGERNKRACFRDTFSLPKKCPYSELFWSVFSRIRTEYGEIRSMSTNSVQMRENTDQNNSEYRPFSRSDFCFYIFEIFGNVEIDFSINLNKCFWTFIEHLLIFSKLNYFLVGISIH